MITLLLLASAQALDARTRRQHRPNPVTILIEPILLARSAVHLVVDPVTAQAPRAVGALAAKPLRLVQRRHEVRPAEVAEGGEPVRVAYLVPRGKNPPSSHLEEELANEQDQDLATEIASGGPTVPGRRAILRDGIAYAPSDAPPEVRNAIWAANSLAGKPYAWGGGHGSFSDRAYDCSGTVSFALHGAGLIDAPLFSKEFMRYGKRGRGRWLTIYARPGHTFAVIAGLRLDTTDFRNGGNNGPRWHADFRDTRGNVARHPAGM